MIWSWFRWLFWTISSSYTIYPIYPGPSLLPLAASHLRLAVWKRSDKPDKSILGRTKPLSTTTPANSHDIVSQNQHIYKHWETHVLPSSDILGPGTSAKKWSSSRRAARRRLRATRAKQRIKHVQTYMGLRAFQLVWQDIYGSCFQHKQEKFVLRLALFDSAICLALRCRSDKFLI